jgi:hypothetical protein
MPERYPNSQSYYAPESTKEFTKPKLSKLSKFEQLKLWIGKEQEANQKENIRVAETGITPIKEITQKAIQKLRSVIDQKSFKKVVKGFAATGAVFMMNLGNVNPAEAKANIQVQKAITATEQVVNTNVTTAKAQQLKKDFGFENVSNTDYSKILKATNSDAENIHDIKQRQTESKAKGIQNLDGTLNRQRSVNKLHLNYLRNIEPMTAPTIGGNENDSTKVGKGTEPKNPKVKETVRKDPTSKTSKTIESQTPIPQPSETPAPKILKTEAILESGNINLNSPAVQKLKAYLGLKDLSNNEDFNKFNDFVKTNITKSQGTRSLKNSAIEDYLKANPVRPVVIKPSPTPSLKPGVPEVKPSPTDNPKPENTETPKPEPSNNPEVNKISDLEKYKSYWEGDDFKNQDEKNRYIQHTLKEINSLIKENNLNQAETEHLRNAKNLDGLFDFYIMKRWLQSKSAKYNQESDQKSILHLKLTVLEKLKLLNLK